MFQDINSSNFKQAVLNHPGKVLVDFWAPWCGPCQMLSPILEQLASSHPDLKIVKVNVDQENIIAMEYNVTSIPTVIIFDKGQLTTTIIGFRQPQDYLSAII